MTDKDDLALEIYGQRYDKLCSLEKERVETIYNLKKARGEI
jgi:hypothetical protein